MDLFLMLFAVVLPGKRLIAVLTLEPFHFKLRTEVAVQLLLSLVGLVAERALVLSKSCHDKDCM